MSRPGRRRKALNAAVTGAAGYLGRALCRRLAAHPGFGGVLALDRQLWTAPAGVEARTLDINDPALADALRGVDAVFHLAFVLGSAGADAQARRVNLDGTRAVCGAARTAGVKTLVVSSSVSAYGALADNPPRLRESDPLRAGPGFRYAHHKAEVERWLDGFEAEDDSVRVVRMRIAVIVGPPPRPGDVTRILSAPVLPLPRSFEVQFVHVDDVAEALVLTALDEGARGAFNLAASPPLSSARIARLTGQRFLPLPGALFRLLSAAARRLPVHDPDRIDFISNPLLVSSARARDELGWRPAHDGEACVRALIDQDCRATSA